MPIPADILEKLKDPHAQVPALNLTGAGITDEDVEELVPLLLQKKELHELFLPRNHITDRGAILLAEAFAQMPELSRIHLGVNAIGPGGAKALAKALANKQKLTMFTITDNPIGDEGIKALAPAMALLPELYYFNAGGNAWTEVGEYVYALSFFCGAGNKLITLGTGSEKLQPLATANAVRAQKLMDELINFPPKNRSIRTWCEAANRWKPVYVFIRRDYADSRGLELANRILQELDSLPTISADEVECFEDLLVKGRYYFNSRAEAPMPEALYQLTPLDNPATWKNFTAIAEALEAKGNPLTKADLFRTNRDGNSYLENAIWSGALTQLMHYLLSRGEKLALEELIDEEGKPTAILQAAIDVHDARPLLSIRQISDWSARDVQRLLNILPEATQGQVQSYALRMRFAQEKQAQQLGRA